MTRRLRRGAVTFGVLLALGVGATFASTSGFEAFGASMDAQRLERARKSPHYRDGRFHNALATTVMKPGSSTSVAMAWLSSERMRAPTCPLPLDPSAKAALATPPESGLRLTWLGHSTVLVELDGFRVLTDPHFSDRASPSRWVGPARFHPPPLALADLPPLDAVVISHDHYDHLDMASVKALAPKTKRFFVALGVGAHLEAWGIGKEQLVELEWWDEVTLDGGLRIVSTPAQHFSGRLLTYDLTLWTSWTLVGPTHRVHFSGDTGLSPHFDAIRERYGPLDVSMLEVGQYDERWGDIHLGPKGALEAHRRLGAAKLLPIHWATFELGLHDWSGPAEDTFTGAAAEGVSLLTPRLGEPVEPAHAAAPTAWWRGLPPTVTACP